MKKILFTLFILLTYSFLSAQPGALDLSFDPGTGANHPVFYIDALALQSDGKIIIGGLFTFFNGTPTGSLARLNTDGTLDTTFHTGNGVTAGAYGLVYALEIQNDGKILVGGAFSGYDGTPANYICRVNPDGSLDTTFHFGNGFNNTVSALKIQADGKILAGGIFTSYNGIPANRIIRLNTDGTADTAFHPLAGANGEVSCIGLYPDNRIAIGGDFTQYDNFFILRTARLHTDGTIDTTFRPFFGAHALVSDLDVKPNDYTEAVVGAFTSVNFQTRGRFALLDGDGNLVYQNYAGAGANGAVGAVKYLPNGNILLGGMFTGYFGTAVNQIVSTAWEGTIDTTFNPGGTGCNNGINDIVLQQDGKIIIAGSFTEYNGVARGKIARLYNCLTSQPGAIAGNDSVLCTQTLTYSVAPVAGAESYEWTLPAGWTFNSDSTANSITVVSDGEGGVISVRAFNDSCGFSIPQTKNIYRNEPPVVPVCLVTVDDSSTHNILLWEKPADKSLIDSFFIYRETTTNVYTKIGAIHRDSLSEFHDYGADPNATSYRYKLSVLDTCGAESAQSPFHNTIHLQNLGSGNFQWTFYQIEGSTNPVTEFNIYRDNLGNGNFQQIGLMPGTNSTFTDVSYFAFPDANYVVDVNWSISCTPQRGTINTTRSNIRGARKTDTLTGIHPVIPDFAVYPNPADDIITLRCSFPQSIQRLQLLNMLGQPVWNEEPAALNHAGEKIIDVGALPKGVYFLSVETSARRFRKKVMVN